MSASTHPSLEYVLVAGIAAGTCYLATPIARGLAAAWGAIARPRDRDVHAVVIPRLGGVAMLAGFALSIFVAEHLPTLSRTFTAGPEIPWILASGALICLIGALDDRYELDSVTKLAGQVVATGIMVTRGGVQLAMVYVPWGDNGTVILSRDISIPVTILLTVLTINAINFIDGLDGLAAGVTAIGAGAFFIFAYHLAHEGRADIASVPALLSAALVGTCLGFLPHNFVPARIFMGDSGSMLVGLMLSAAATTATTSTDPQTLSDAGTYLPIVLPLIVVVAVLAVPFIDLLLAVIRRISRGQSPFAPDKRHLHHRLLELGHSHRRAVLLMYFWSGLLAFGVTWYSISRGPWILLLMIAVGAVIGVFLLVVPRLRGHRRISDFAAETRVAARAGQSPGGGGAA